MGAQERFVWNSANRQAGRACPVDGIPGLKTGLVAAILGLASAGQR
jgi:hypothetical protein